MRFFKGMLALAGWLAVVCAAPAHAADDGDVYSERGVNACIKCHDKGTASEVLYTSHAITGDRRTPFAAHGCESCHGPSSRHLLKPPEGEKRVPPSVVFKGQNISPVEERNKVCIGCHESGMRMNWQGSQHQANDVACTSCHSAHAQKDPVLVKKTQPEICFACHAEQRAQTLRPSHHPIREGKVACSDCHNGHGSPAPAMLTRNRVNDTCYGCHAEKRGPFLWEHAPVREDCNICHTPHGSVQPRLLKERAPWMCQNCHDSGQHPTTLYGANTATRQSIARSCLNCHNQVHGSNHPSGNFNMR